MTNQITEGYCVKCHSKQVIKDANEITMKGKGGSTRRAMQGTCPVCGTKMFRFLPSKKSETEEKKETGIEKEMENFNEV